MSRDALVVGVNTYEYSRLKSLKAPAEDAEAIARILTEYGDFNVVNRLPAIKDKENDAFRVGRSTTVKLMQFKEALVRLFKPQGENIPDTALLYFSGHGLRQDLGIQEGFLATSDVNPDEDRWGVSLRWLRQLLRESPIRQQIVWLDCCYSGELMNFSEADPGDRGQGKSLFLIAASRDFEVAYEEVNGQHGVLTAALLKGLDPHRDREGAVTNDSLIAFIKEELKGQPQQPLWYNPNHEIILTGTPQELLQPDLTGECPYKGLRYFDVADAAYFHGREILTDKLLDRVKIGKGNFLAVLGASGSGKSSLVRAGLLYKLQQGQHLSGSEKWQICIFIPGSHPLQNLAEVFVDGTATTARAEQLKIAEAAVAEGATGLTRLIRASLAPRTMVFIDQFEEMFTLCQSSTDREQFFACLLGTLTQTGDKLCIVLAMRADFFGKCTEQEYCGLAEMMQSHLINVKPMTAQELERAIREPAKSVGIKVEENLVKQILTDLGVTDDFSNVETNIAREPGSLPLLEFTLEQLWQYRELDRLTLNTYVRLGGVKKTLEKYANEVYQSLQPEELKSIAKQIFLNLTQLGEGTEDTRRRVLKKDLITSRQSADLVNEVVSKLSTARLIVTDRLQARSDSEEGEIVEVAHEALIRYWGELKKWVSVNRDAIRVARKIEDAAREWQSNGKLEDEAYLMQGTKLVEAENFLQDYADLNLLSNLSSEFVAVSRKVRDDRLKAEEKRRSRELSQEKKARRAAQITAMVSFAAVGVVTVFGIQAEQRKNTAVEALISEPQRLLETNNQLEALIASVKALKQLKEIGGQNANALIQLKSTINKVREYNRLEGHSAPVVGVSFSPNGQRIVSGSTDGTIKIWNTNGELITTQKDGDQVWGVEFSPDGNMIASTSNTGIIKLWSQKGESLGSLTGHNGRVFSVRFKDNKTLASSGDDGIIRLWDITTKKNFSIKDEDIIKYNAIKDNAATIFEIDFSRDGQYIASTGHSKGLVKIWSLKGEKIRELAFSNLSKDEFMRIVSSVKFSPDGEMIAASNYNGYISIWSVKDWHLIKNFRAHKDHIYDLAFSPDSKMIASVSRDTDRRVALWNLDGKLIENIKGHTSGVNQVKFQQLLTPIISQLIASTSDDNTIRLWRLGDKDKDPPEIDRMLENSCNFLHDYLLNNKSRNLPTNRRICDNADLKF
jgi:WD40 repeat protein/energy-coupling factor transporter ATP-binding protein EcfA2